MSSSWGWPEAKTFSERLSAPFSTRSQSTSSENWPQAFAHRQVRSALGQLKDAGLPELKATNWKQAECQEHKEAVVQHTKEHKAVHELHAEERLFWWRNNCAHCPGEGAGAMCSGKLKVIPSSCLFSRYLPLVCFPIPIRNSWAISPNFCEASSRQW